MTSNTIIQCTPSSSHTTRTYDVFLSFRGEDTRNNFTGFLFQALRSKGIDAFKDDTHLTKGESVAPELLQAIQGSRIFVVVFSKNYASSTWCSRELAHICTCIEISPRSVMPIFYDVDPSEVRKQSGCYEKAFTQHEERFREDKEKMEEVQRWRKALIHVANLSGWDIRNKPQYAEIEQIVQNILNILGPKFSSLPREELVGIESRVEELSKLLHLGSDNDIRVVGISGMGGIGKTTLARAFYERISHQYIFHSFVDDVSKIYRDSNALGVQKQFLSQSLNEKNLEICNISEGTCLVWTRLFHARALIVFDNVDQVGQLKMFTGSRDTLLRECLGGGSRIIIISRDEHILRTLEVDDVYQVQPLNRKDAGTLFCKNAFKSNYIMRDYEELTFDVLSHAQGHPLAIEVVGSTLFGRNVSQWRSALARLRENKGTKVMDVLRITFDELDEIDKEIFLDIACLFSNYEVQYVMGILDFRGFHPEYGLQVLIDKSLITIKNGKVEMHPLLRDFGRCIVREKSPKEPRKWSRLWDDEDLYKVMSSNMEAENLEAIDVMRSKMLDETMRADALSKMSHLKVLHLYSGNFSGSLSYLSNELGYLTWNGYPFESLPPSFQPDKLVELVLCSSSIKQLWEGTKPLTKLRDLILYGCKHLTKIIDFSEAPNLEYLNLGECVQLRQLDPSIGLLKKLITLNLKGCISLIKIPSFGEGLNLEMLNLEGCTQLRQIDPSLGFLRKLTFLNLKDCKNLVSLPSSILSLSSLEYLSLSGCSKLYDIHLLDEPRNTMHTKKLRVGEASIHSRSISSIAKRWFMWPLHLLKTRALEVSVSCLMPSSPTFPCMRQLDLSFCNLLQIPDAVGNMHCLESLDLRGNNFATLPNLKELSKLYYLNLVHCNQLKYLPELPSRTDSPSQVYKEWPMIVHPYGERGVGLYIFNCPELVEREFCTSMSLSWIIQILKWYHTNPRHKFDEYIQFHPTIQSIFPGREIPSWFNNQHMGSLISIEGSPQVQHDNNWIGIACCAISMARHGKGKFQNSILAIRFPVVLDGELVADESEYLLLFYFSRRHFEGFCGILGNPSDLKWEFEVSDKQGLHFEVKRYGYRWVYQQDLELSNLTKMQSGNSLARKRKFLAIEENK